MLALVEKTGTHTAGSSSKQAADGESAADRSLLGPISMEAIKHAFLTAYGHSFVHMHRYAQEVLWCFDL